VNDGVAIPKDLLDEMIEHCRAGRPNEACGMLASKDGRIVKVFRMTNDSGSPVRYSLDSREQLAVYNTIEREDWDLGGVFHSHTHTDAYPSPTDVRLASEDVPYLIVSFAADPPVVRAFRINKRHWEDPDPQIKEVEVDVVG
jgi:[CysO sulfur-carrier protein]-S-L-cysteine hydrolase